MIGIPFYLADAGLAQLEKQTNDLEDAREIMMYLRHEAGHAFNYAYKLHRTAEWKQFSGRSAGLITTTIGLFRSREIMCAIWQDGMRRNIPTKISPKLLQCG